MTTIAPDVHETYGVLMVMSVVLLLLTPTTKQFTRSEDRGRYYTMQAITALGAAAGAKLGVLFGDALWPLRPFDDWSALLASGRSIAGALLFGFLAVEAAKPLLRYDIPPNDRFAVMLPFSIAIGRIGCLVAGCCRGAPWDGPLAITYADGIPRHPAQLYEALFQLAAGWALRRRRRSRSRSTWPTCSGRSLRGERANAGRRLSVPALGVFSGSLQAARRTAPDPPRQIGRAHV